MAANADILGSVGELIAQEKSLRAQLAAGEIDASQEHEQLRAIEVKLDQCWDLLRQRDAEREDGGQPARLRSADVVEHYQQ